MDEAMWQQVALGKSFFEKGQYYEAEECLQKVIGRGGRYADVFCMMGVIAHERQGLGEARKFFDSAVSLNPSYVDAWLGLSLTLGEMGLYEEAGEAKERARQIREGKPGELDGYVKQKIANRYSEVGELLMSSGWPGKAAEEYKRALELCPEFIDIRLKLANAYMAGGEWEGAVEAFEKIIGAEPDYFPARVRYGLALYSRGKVAEAREMWEYVLQKNPEDRIAKMYMNLVETQ